MKKSSFASKLLSSVLSLTLAVAMVPSAALAEAGDTGTGDVPGAEGGSSEETPAPAQAYAAGNYDVDISFDKVDGSHMTMAIPSNNSGYNYKATVVVADDGTATIRYAMSKTSYDGYWIGLMGDKPASVADAKATENFKAFELIDGVYYYSAPFDLSQLGTSTNVCLSKKTSWYTTQLQLNIGAKMVKHLDPGTYDLACGITKVADGSSYGMFTPTSYCGKTLLNVSATGDCTLSFYNDRTTYNGIYLGTVAEAQADTVVNDAIANETIAPDTSPKYIVGKLNGSRYEFVMPVKMTDLGTSIPVTLHYSKASTSRPDLWGPYSNKAYTDLTFNLADKATGHYEDGDYELTVTTVYGEGEAKEGQPYTMLAWEKYGKPVVHIDGKNAAITMEVGVDTYDGLFFGTTAEAIAAGKDSSAIIAGTHDDVNGKGYIFSFPFNLELLGTTVDVTPRYVDLTKSESGFGPFSKGAYVPLKLVYGDDMKLIETATPETQAIIDGIEALPAPEAANEDDAEIVWALRDAYNATAASQQIFVTNIDKLAAVEAALIAKGIVRLPAMSAKEYPVYLGTLSDQDQILQARLMKGPLGLRVTLYAKKGEYNCLYFGAGDTLDTHYVTLRSEGDYLEYIFDRSDSTSSQYGLTEQFTLATRDNESGAVTYGPAVEVTFPAGCGNIPAGTYDQGEFAIVSNNEALAGATAVTADGNGQTATVTVPEGKVMVVGKKADAVTATADQYLTGTASVAFRGISGIVDVCLADAPAAGATVAANAWTAASFHVEPAGAVKASIEANSKLVDWEHYSTDNGSTSRLWSYFHSTLASWDNLVAARAAYDALSETDKALVEFVNGAMMLKTERFLTPIKECDDALKALPTADEVLAAIAAGADAEEAKASVKALRAQYNNLEAASGANTAKGAVPAEDLAKLEALEAALGIDAEAEAAVIDLIYDLADQTAENLKSYAVEVRAEYDNLSKPQKAAVYNYAWLAAAYALKTNSATYTQDAQALIDGITAVTPAVKAIAALSDLSTTEQVLEAQKAVAILEDIQDPYVCNIDALAKIAADKAVVLPTGNYVFEKSIVQGSNKTCVQLTKTSAADNMMFRIVDATLTVDAEGNMVAEVTASGTGQDKVFMGTKLEAEAALEAGGEGMIAGVACVNSEGKDAYKFTIPVASFDQVIPMASYSSKNKAFYDRALIFSAENLVQVMDPATQAVIDAIEAIDAQAAAGTQPTIADIEAARAGLAALNAGQRALLPSGTIAKLDAAFSNAFQNVTWSDQTVNVSYKDAAQSKALAAAQGAKTAVTYTKDSGDKALSVTADGKVVVAKGTMPGTYTMFVIAKAAEGECYYAAGAAATITVKVAKAAQPLGVQARIAAVNYNGSITKASYPIKAVTANGAVVESIASDGTHTAGPAAGKLGDISFSYVSGSKYLSVTTSGKTAGVKTGKVTVAPKTPVGEYTCVVRVTAAATADGKYAKTTKDVTVKVQVKRFAPTISVLGKVVRTASATTLKSKSVTVACPITKIQCASKPMTYALSGAKNAAGKDMKLKFTVNKTTGAITVAKGTAKGTYTVSLKVMSDDNANYKGNYRIVATKVVVK